MTYHSLLSGLIWPVKWQARSKRKSFSFVLLLQIVIIAPTLHYTFIAKKRKHVLGINHLCVEVLGCWIKLKLALLDYQHRINLNSSFGNYHPPPDISKCANYHTTYPKITQHAKIFSDLKFGLKDQFNKSIVWI